RKFWPPVCLSPSGYWEEETLRRITLMIIAALAPLAITQRASAQTATSSVSYSIADRGAASVETVGGADAMTVGYGSVQPAVTTPAGVAIFGLRQNGVLVTETGVPVYD